MSMRDYAVNDYGLLMTEDMLKCACSKYCKGYIEEDYEENEFDYKDELYDAGIVEFISEFTGEAIHINDDGIDDWRHNGDNYNDDMIYYIPAKRESTLFMAAYSNIEELVNEFKEKIGEYLEEDFDYRNYVRHIVGTYFG